MASTLSLRRRIKTAQNISKTTRAMQMIAASKLKRAQEATFASRPYVNKLTALTQQLTPKKEITDTLHPYMQSTTGSGKTLYIIISPDKGLCGGLVTNLIREYFKVRHDNKTLFITVGKKIEGPVAAAHKNLLASFPFGNTVPSYDMIFPIIEVVDDYFLTHKVDHVKIITTHFNNVFSQNVKIFDLLPIMIQELDPGQARMTKNSDFRLFEPTSEELLPPLLKKYIEMQIFQHLLESYASEQAARMMAMQNATNNAKDIVNTLQLLYNKARQEKITSEILDIISASVALENQE